MSDKSKSSPKKLTLKLLTEVAEKMRAENEKYCSHDYVLVRRCAKCKKPLKVLQ